MAWLLPFATLVGYSLAKTVTYNWDISWVTAAPDGFQRPTIGINGKWPLPAIEADLGDTVVVKVTNSLGNETTSIHFHGQYQKGTNHMDGPSGVTQCPIPPGSTFTYQFTAGPAGTYWYHSHNKGQYPDGLRGPLIVHDRRREQRLGYDKEYTMTLSDWYHDQMPKLVHLYLSKDNLDATGGAEPIPYTSLVNDKQTETFKLEPNKKYLFRIIGMSALAAHYVKFEDHPMTVVAIDGVPVKPVKTDTIEVSAAQRYDVLITGIKNPQKNYAFVAFMDQDMFDDPTVVKIMKNDGVLSYSSSFPNPNPLPDTTFTALDDMTLVPCDKAPLLKDPAQTITLNVNFSSYDIGQRGALGTTSYMQDKVPALYTALTVGKHAMNPIVYGKTVNPYVLKHGDVIQVVVNNFDDGGHPFHMHGHQFQVVARSNAFSTPTPWNGDVSGFPAIPMRRDTVKVLPDGYAVLRFRADNPGITLFHCHLEWHVEAGLTVTFIEAPDKLQEQGIKIPADHLAACAKQGIPTQGNCAGNTRNPLDVSMCMQPETWDLNNYGALINPPALRRIARRRR